MQIQTICFSKLLPGPVGETLDAHFSKKGWQLQRWNRGGAIGYQVFFGKQVQVDNSMEYGFPHLYEEEDLLAFAQDFYQCLKSFAPVRIGLSADKQQ